MPARSPTQGTVRLRLGRLRAAGPQRRTISATDAAGNRSAHTRLGFRVGG